MLLTSHLFRLSRWGHLFLSSRPNDSPTGLRHGPAMISSPFNRTRGSQMLQHSLLLPIGLNLNQMMLLTGDWRENRWALRETTQHKSHRPTAASRARACQCHVPPQHCSVIASGLLTEPVTVSIPNYYCGVGDRPFHLMLTTYVKYLKEMY
jgi:hypothetical protein